MREELTSLYSSIRESRQFPAPTLSSEISGLSKSSPCRTRPGEQKPDMLHRVLKLAVQVRSNHGHGVLLLLPDRILQKDLSIPPIIPNSKSVKKLMFRHPRASTLNWSGTSILLTVMRSPLLLMSPILSTIQKLMKRYLRVSPETTEVSRFRAVSMQYLM